MVGIDKERESTVSMRPHRRRLLPAPAPCHFQYLLRQQLLWCCPLPLSGNWLWFAPPRHPHRRPTRTLLPRATRSAGIFCCDSGLGMGKEGPEQSYNKTKCSDKCLKIIRDLLEAIVEDLWDDSGKQWTAHFKARSRVDFNQIQAEVFVDHKVVPEQLFTTNKSAINSTWSLTYLELVLEPLRVNLVESCLVRVSNELLHLRENVTVEVKV